MAPQEDSWPSERHAGSQWGNLDWWRALQSGALGFIGIFVDYKGDWAEFAHRFGFPTWGKLHACCFLCNTTKRMMTRILALREFDQYTDETYEEECSKSEVWKKQQK